MFKKRKEDGFTLIELMIVIAIIGILAVVLVPKMAGLKTGAKVTGVQTNLSSVEAYCESKIATWDNATNTSGIATDIQTQFNLKSSGIPNDLTTANTLINPLNNSSNAITFESTPADGSGTKGAVNVDIPSDISGLTTTGIIITGYDNNGKAIGTYTVK